MARYNRGRSDLRRKRNTRRENPRILIVCEGEVTEPQYFKGLSKALRATGVEVTRLDIVGLGRDPTRVVDAAASRSGMQAGRLLKDESYDDVWCVFDTDDHKLLEKALRDASRLSIKVALTNPCFELWLLWHFVDHTSYVTAADLKRLLRLHGVTGKELPRTFPFGRYVDAMRRSEASCRGCEITSLPNPASTVFRLAEVLSAAKS